MTRTLADPVWKACMLRVQLEKYGGMNVPEKDFAGWSDYCTGEAKAMRLMYGNGGASLFPTTRPSGWPGGSLTPGTFPTSGGYGVPYSLDKGGVGDVTNLGCQLIPAGIAREACLRLSGIVFGGGGGNGGGGGGGGMTLDVPCPQGYKKTASGGCQLEGPAAYIPGDIGRQDFGWGAVNGRYGAGYVPIKVQRDYSACPPGAKLGKDGVCYDHIARSNRKHDPGARPFLTGGEVNVVRRAKRLAKRFHRLRSGKGALFPGARTCAPRKGKKK